ncbi:MAG: GDSL-type esterase/lipase family protein [Methylococcaceae bacterium]
MIIQNRKFAIALLFVIPFLLITYGVGSISYGLFPFQQHVVVKKPITLKPLNQDDSLTEYPYWKDKTTLFLSLHSTAKNLMIGDSIIDAAEWNELFPETSILNRGIAGDTAYGVTRRLDSLINTNPDNAFIMLGINDIMNNRKIEKIVKDYIQILTTLQSNKITPIIQSTLYVSSSFPSYREKNDAVTQLNTELAEYANKNDITFVNLNDKLSINETLKSEFTNDGIHLTGAGYQIWKSKISKYIEAPPH